MESIKKLKVDIVADAKKFIEPIQDAITKLEKTTEKVDFLDGLKDDVKEIQEAIEGIDFNNLADAKKTEAQIDALTRSFQSLRVTISTLKGRVNLIDLAPAQQQIDLFIDRFNNLQKIYEQLNSQANAFSKKNFNLYDIASVEDLEKGFKRALDLYEELEEKRQKSPSKMPSKDYKEAIQDLYRFIALTEEIDKRSKQVNGKANSLLSNATVFGTKDNIVKRAQELKKEIGKSLGDIKTEIDDSFASISSTEIPILNSQMQKIAYKVSNYTLKNGKVIVPVVLEDNLTRKLDDNISSIIKELSEKYKNTPIEIEVKIPEEKLNEIYSITSEKIKQLQTELTEATKNIVAETGVAQEIKSVNDMASSVPQLVSKINTINTALNKTQIELEAVSQDLETVGTKAKASIKINTETKKFQEYADQIKRIADALSDLNNKFGEKGITLSIQEESLERVNTQLNQMYQLLLRTNGLVDNQKLKHTFDFFKKEFQSKFDEGQLVRTSKGAISEAKKNVGELEKIFLRFIKEYKALGGNLNIADLFDNEIDKKKINKLYNQFLEKDEGLQKIVEDAHKNKLTAIAVNVDGQKVAGKLKEDLSKSPIPVPVIPLLNPTDFISKIQESLKNKQVQVSVTPTTKLVSSQNTTDSVIPQEAQPSIDKSKIAYHWGTLNNEPSHKFGSEKTTYSNGMRNGGIPWGGGTGSYVLFNPASLSSLDTSDPNNSGKKFFAIDTSKLNLFKAESQEAADEFQKFIHQLEQFILNTAHEFPQFKENLEGVTEGSLFESAKKLFPNFKMKIGEFTDWITSMSKIAKIGVQKSGAIRLDKIKLDYGTEDFKTRFLKKLGYQGYDLSGTSYDNFNIGSVLFENFAKKNVIASADTVSGLETIVSEKIKESQQKVQPIQQAVITTTKELDKQSTQVSIEQKELDELKTKVQELSLYLKNMELNLKLNPNNIITDIEKGNFKHASQSIESLIRSMIEADKIQYRTTNQTEGNLKERLMMFNPSTGKHTNPLVFGGDHSASVDLMNNALKGHEAENLTSFLHTHTIKGTASFSPSDILVAFEQKIQKMYAVTMEEIAELDASKLRNDIERNGGKGKLKEIIKQWQDSWNNSSTPFSEVNKYISTPIQNGGFGGQNIFAGKLRDELIDFNLLDSVLTPAFKKNGNAEEIKKQLKDFITQAVPLSDITKELHNIPLNADFYSSIQEIQDKIIERLIESMDTDSDKGVDKIYSKASSLFGKGLNADYKGIYDKEGDMISFLLRMQKLTGKENFLDKFKHQYNYSDIGQAFNQKTIRELMTKSFKDNGFDIGKYVTTHQSTDDFFKKHSELSRAIQDSKERNTKDATSVNLIPDLTNFEEEINKQLENTEIPVKIVPNMEGLVSSIQNNLNNQVFDIKTNVTSENVSPRDDSKYKKTLTDKNGNPILVYRGVTNALDGSFTNNEDVMGGTFWSPNVVYATNYGVNEPFVSLHKDLDSLDKIYQGVLKYNNLYEIDAHEAPWNLITNASYDETGKKFATLNSNLTQMISSIANIFSDKKEFNLESELYEKITSIEKERLYQQAQQEIITKYKKEGLNNNIDIIRIVGETIKKNIMSKSEEMELPDFKAKFGFFDSFLNDSKSSVDSFLGHLPQKLADYYKKEWSTVLESMKDYVSIIDDPTTMSGFGTTRDFAKKAKASGYDALYLKNIAAANNRTIHDEVVTFDETQIDKLNTLNEEQKKIALQYLNKKLFSTNLYQKQLDKFTKDDIKNELNNIIETGPNAFNTHMLKNPLKAFITDAIGKFVDDGIYDLTDEKIIEELTTNFNIEHLTDRIYNYGQKAINIQKEADKILNQNLNNDALSQNNNKSQLSVTPNLDNFIETIQTYLDGQSVSIKVNPDLSQIGENLNQEVIETLSKQQPSSNITSNVDTSKELEKKEPITATSTTTTTTTKTTVSTNNKTDKIDKKNSPKKTSTPKKDTTSQTVTTNVGEKLNGAIEDWVVEEAQKLLGQIKFNKNKSVARGQTSLINDFRNNVYRTYKEYGGEKTIEDLFPESKALQNKLKGIRPKRKYKKKTITKEKAKKTNISETKNEENLERGIKRFNDVVRLNSNGTIGKGQEQYLDSFIKTFKAYRENGGQKTLEDIFTNGHVIRKLNELNNITPSQKKETTKQKTEPKQQKKSESQSSAKTSEKKQETKQISSQNKYTAEEIDQHMENIAKGFVNKITLNKNGTIVGNQNALFMDFKKNFLKYKEIGGEKELGDLITNKNIVNKLTNMINKTNTQQDKTQSKQQSPKSQTTSKQTKKEDIPQNKENTKKEQELTEKQLKTGLDLFVGSYKDLLDKKIEANVLGLPNEELDYLSKREKLIRNNLQNDVNNEKNKKEIPQLVNRIQKYLDNPELMIKEVYSDEDILGEVGKLSQAENDLAISSQKATEAVKEQTSSNENITPLERLRKAYLSVMPFDFDPKSFSSSEIIDNYMMSVARLFNNEKISKYQLKDSKAKIPYSQIPDEPFKWLNDFYKDYIASGGKQPLKNFISETEVLERIDLIKKQNNAQKELDQNEELPFKKTNKKKSTLEKTHTKIDASKEADLYMQEIIKNFKEKIKLNKNGTVIKGQDELFKWLNNSYTEYKSKGGLNSIEDFISNKHILNYLAKGAYLKKEEKTIPEEKLLDIKGQSSEITISSTENLQQAEDKLTESAKQATEAVEAQSSANEKIEETSKKNNAFEKKEMPFGSYMMQLYHEAQKASVSIEEEPWRLQQGVKDFFENNKNSTFRAQVPFLYENRDLTYQDQKWDFDKDFNLLSGKIKYLDEGTKQTYIDYYTWLEDTIDLTQLTRERLEDFKKVIGLTDEQIEQMIQEQYEKRLGDRVEEIGQKKKKIATINDISPQERDDILVETRQNFKYRYFGVSGHEAIDNEVARVKTQEKIKKEQSSLKEWLSRFDSQTLGVLKETAQYKELSSMDIVSDSDIERVRTLKNELKETYNIMVQDARKGKSSLNPVVDMLNASDSAQGQLDNLINKYASLTVGSDKAQNALTSLQNILNQINQSAAENDFLTLADMVGDFRVKTNELNEELSRLARINKEVKGTNIQNLFRNFSLLDNPDDINFNMEGNLIDSYVDDYTILKSELLQIKVLLGEISKYGFNTDEYKNGIIQIQQLTKEANKLQKDLNSEKYSITNKYGTVIGQNISSSDQARKMIGQITSNYTSATGLKITPIQLDNGETLTKFVVQVKNANNEIETLAFTYDSAMETIRQSTVKIEQPTSMLDALFERLSGKWGEVLTWFATHMTLQEFFYQLRQGFQIIHQFDDALAEMQKVSSETLDTLKEYQKTTFDLADSVGSTALTIQQSTANWMRLGESMEEASKSAQISAILFNVSEFESIDAATESLVAMSAAYEDLNTHIDKMDIIDKLNKVGNDFSISTDGLATALQESASALRTAGSSIDESIALITAGNAVVQNPSKVGAGLRTIALRLTGTSASKAELEANGEEVEGMITNVSKLRDVIMQATKVEANGFKGFDILTDVGSYKTPYEILSGIAEIYEDIVELDKKTGNKQANLLLETLAGKTRANIAASILQNPEMLKKAFEESQNAEGSALEENEKMIDSITGHLNKLTNAWQQMWANTANRDVINFFLDLATAVLKVVDAIGLIPTTALVGGGLISLIQLTQKESGLTKLVQDLANITQLSKDKGEKKGGFLSSLFKAVASSPIEEIKEEPLKEVVENIGEASGEGIKDVADNAVEGASKVIKEKIQKATKDGLDKGGQEGGSNLVKTLSNNFKSLGTIILGNLPVIFGAITIAAGAAIATWAIDQNNLLSKQTEEEAKIIRSGYKEAINNAQEHKDLIDSISESEGKLFEGVDLTNNHNLTLTNDEYKEYLNTVNKIASIYPSLVSGYDAQGNAILRLKDNANSLTETLQELYIQEQKTAAIDALKGGEKRDRDSQLDSFNSLFKTSWLDQLLDFGDISVGGTISANDAKQALEKAMNIPKMDYNGYNDFIADLGIDYIQYSYLQQLGLDAQTTQEEFEQLRPVIASEFNKLNDTVLQGYTNFRTMLSQMAHSQDNFYGVNGVDNSDIISSILGNLSEERIDELSKKSMDEIQREVNNLIAQVNNKIILNGDDFIQLNDISSSKGINSLNKVLQDMKDYSSGKGALSGLNIKDFTNVANDYKKVINEAFGEGTFDSLFDDQGIFGLEDRFEEILNNTSFTKRSHELRQEAKDTFYSLTKDQAEAYLEAWKGAENLNDVNQKYAQNLRVLSARTYEAIVNIEDETGAINTLTSALSSSASGNGLSEEEIGNITSLFQDVVDFDENKLLENTANGVHLNVEELERLNKERAEINIKKQGKELDKYTEELEASQKALEELKNEYDAGKRSLEDYQNAYSQEDNIRQGIENKINLLRREMAQYSALTSAYNQYVQAQSSANENARYENIGSGYETTKDLIERGWIGQDDVRAYLNMFTQNDMMTASSEELYAVWNKIDDKINSAGYSLKDFFTYDENGKSTSDGIFNFLDTVKQAAKDSGQYSEETLNKLVSKDKEGNYSFDFDIIGGDNKIADLLGVDLSLIQAIIQAARDAGFEVQMTEALPGLESLTDKIRNARDRLKELGLSAKEIDKYKVDLSLDFSNAENYESATKTLLDSIDEIKNSDMSPEVKDASLDYVNGQLDAIIAKKAILSLPTALSYDTSEVETGFQTLYSSMQNYWLLQNELTQRKTLGLDTSKNEADLKAMTKDIFGLLKAMDEADREELGFGDIDFTADTEKILSQIEEKLKEEDLELHIPTTLEDPNGDPTKGIDSQKVTIDIQFSVDGKTLVLKDITSVQQAAENLDGTNANVDATANTAQAEEGLAGVAEEKGKAEGSFEIEGKGKNIGILQSAVKNARAEARDKSFTITALSSGFSGIIDFFKNIYNKITNKSVTITTNYATTGGGGNVGGGKRAVPLNGSGYNGTAHALGTAYARGTSGNWGVPEDQDALTGELGEELVVRNGRFFTVGSESAEMVHLQKGDIVFNADQTKQIFEKGRIINGSRRGKAHADGTAYSAGSGGRRRTNAVVANSKTSNNSSSNNNNNKSNNKKSSSNNNNNNEAEKMDWIAIAIERIEQQIDELNDVVDSVYRSWSDRNKALTKEIKAVSDEIAIQQAGYKRYLKEAESIGLSEAYAKKVREGTIDIQKITDEKLKKKIDEYQQWYKAAEDCRVKIAELEETENELYQQKIDNIITRYEAISNKYQDQISSINALMDLAEEQGLNSSSKYYKALQDWEEKNLKALTTERQKAFEQLQDNISEGMIIRGSEQWLETVSNIDQITESIINSQKALVEYNNEIRQINWDNFDLGQERIEKVTDEAQFMIDTLSNEELFDEKGTYTAQGLASQALHISNLEAYTKQSEQYAEAIEEARDAIAKDPYNQELIDRYYELIEAQQDAINNIYSEKDAIKDLIEQGIDKELESLQKLIDKYKDAISSQSDLLSYQDNVTDQAEEVAKIQKQIAAYSGDNSEESRLKVQQLQQSLKDAQKALSDTQREHNESDITESLDSLYEQYEELLNEKLKDTDALISDVVERVNANGSDIRNAILESANKVDYTLTEALNNIVSIADGSTIATKVGQTIAGILQNVISTDNNSDTNAKNKLNDTPLGIEDYGWQTDKNGNMQYREFGASDVVKNGMHEINGKNYYFDENGNVATGFIKNGGKTYYFNEETRQMGSGLTEVEGEKYYFDPNTKEMQTGNVTINGKDYYFSQKTGKQLYGLRDVNGNKYYYDSKSGGAKTSGWQTIDNQKYYFDPNTKQMVHGLQTIDNKKYYFDEDGKAIKGFKDIDGFTYYFKQSDNSALTSNWLDYKASNGKIYRYRLNKSSHVVKNKKSTIGGNTYYFDEEGRILTKKNGSPKTYAKKQYNYSTGVYKVGSNRKAWTQEYGKTEAIIRPTDGAILTPIVKNDSVLDPVATKNMFAFFNNPTDLFKQFTDGSNYESIPNSITNNTVGDINVTFNIAGSNITDFQTFMTECKNSPQFEKMVRAMTVDRMFGGSALKKFKV